MKHTEPHVVFVLCRVNICVSAYLADCPLCSSWERSFLARPSYGPSSSDSWDNRPHSESECVCLKVTEMKEVLECCHTTSRIILDYLAFKYKLKVKY